MKRLMQSAALALTMGMNRFNPPIIDEAHKIGRKTERKIKKVIKREPYKAQVFYTNPDPLQAALNKMTNWQRNQAGRACKGNWKNMTPEKLEHFCNLKKPA